MKTWKDIPGYEDLYMASIEGKIKVLQRSWVTGKNLLRTKPEHELRLFKKSNGYYHTQLTKDGVMSQFSVHRLLAITFLSNPQNKKCVNHINGIKDDNRIENLEWASYKDNNHHALNSGLRRISKKDLLTGQFIKL